MFILCGHSGRFIFSNRNTTFFENTEEDTDLNIGPLSVHQLTDDFTEFIRIGELAWGEENRHG